MKQLVNGVLGRAGLELRRKGAGQSFPRFDLIEPIEPHWEEILAKSSPYSITGMPRLYVAGKAVEYVTLNRIPGAIVECGVYRGGTVMAMALALRNYGEKRDVWLYDTFEGMSKPTEKDVSGAGLRAIDEWKDGRATELLRVEASLRDVRRNVASTDYPRELTHYVKGKVEETLPAQMPEQIAVLRLDTDWYESTLHELKHLYPRLVPGGVLILDDYGHWMGAKQAVDEYFRDLGVFPFLIRTDYTNRVMIKR